MFAMRKCVTPQPITDSASHNFILQSMQERCGVSFSYGHEQYLGLEIPDRGYVVVTEEWSNNQSSMSSFCNYYRRYVTGSDSVSSRRISIARADKATPFSLAFFYHQYTARSGNNCGSHVDFTFKYGKYLLLAVNHIGHTDDLEYYLSNMKYLVLVDLTETTENSAIMYYGILHDSFVSTSPDLAAQVVSATKVSSVLNNNSMYRFEFHVTTDDVVFYFYQAGGTRSVFFRETIKDYFQELSLLIEQMSLSTGSGFAESVFKIDEFWFSDYNALDFFESARKFT